jgi:hypothetical protein
MLFIQLLSELRRVKLDSLEAQLRPIEQLNKRPALLPEGRITHWQLLRRREYGLNYLRHASDSFEVDHMPHLTSMLNALLNSANNWLALSRGQSKSIGFADLNF